MGVESAESALTTLSGLLKRMPDLFRDSWDAVALYRLDGTVVTGNTIAVAMIGGVGLRDRHFTTHLSEDQRTFGEIHFAETVASGKPGNYETKFLRPDGVEVEVEVRLVPAHLDGELVGIYGLARDITQRRKSARDIDETRQRLESLFENHPDSITMMDLSGRYQRANRAAEELTGYTQADFIGHLASELFDHSGPRQLDAVLAAIKRRESFTFEHSIVRKDGRTLAIEGRSIPIIVDGEVCGAYTVARDITDKKRLEARQSRDSERMRHLYQISSSGGMTPRQRMDRALRDGMLQLNADWGFVARTDESLMMVDYSVGRGVPFHPGYTVGLEHTMVRHVAASQELLLVEDMRVPPWSDDPSGRAALWRSMVVAPLLVGDRLYGVAGFLNEHRTMVLEETDRDYVAAVAALIAAAVERDLQLQRLSDLAHQDALTGLPNRALLLDRLDQTLLQSLRYKRSFALHFIDFDRFKAVNDTYGHAAGDQLLVAAAAALSGVLRESDTLARIGGDEFVVLQPELQSEGDAVALARRLQRSVSRPFMLGGAAVHAALSVGTAVFPRDGDNAATLLAVADRALYAAKSAMREAARTDAADGSGVSASPAAEHVPSTVETPSHYASLHHLLCRCGHTAFSHGQRGCRVPTRRDGQLTVCGCVRTLEHLYAGRVDART